MSEFLIKVEAITTRMGISRGKRVAQGFLALNIRE